MNQHTENEPHDRSHPKDEREFVIIGDNGALSVDQRRTAGQLLRLYQSLCGGQPGQYWPQALLDTAGRFNRPPFPGRDQGRK
jgi:hypothetical protein